MDRVGGACLHGGQHRGDGWGNCTSGPAPCRAGEVDPVPNVPQVKGLMAHGGEDATTERPVVGRLRHPERLGHVPLRELMPAGVVCHPADAEGELCGGAEQRPADWVGESAAEKRGHLAAEVRYREGSAVPPPRASSTALRLCRIARTPSTSVRPTRREPAVRSTASSGGATSHRGATSLVTAISPTAPKNSRRFRWHLHNLRSVATAPSRSSAHRRPSWVASNVPSDEAGGTSGGIVGAAVRRASSRRNRAEPTKLVGSTCDGDGYQRGLQSPEWSSGHRQSGTVNGPLATRPASLSRPRTPPCP